ncbi:MAG: RNA polymerase sigma factor (sigma-70 family) [Cyclobacteriaceae bacterium]|jgi:RNA polymerase sigma factor (sigma-70 family)
MKERQITDSTSAQAFPNKRNSSSDEKDEQLVWDSFIKGDDESLVYIYSNYADILYRYGRQFTKRPEFIRDCIQELFFELIKKRERLSPALSIKAYLFSALKRKIFRDIKKEEKLVLEEEGFNLNLSEPSVSISKVLDKNDLAIIQSKLNLLSANQREAILLHFYEGLTYAEIAEIMNIKVRSARVLTYRALDSLHKQLKPYKNQLYTLLLIHLSFNQQ